MWFVLVLSAGNVELTNMQLKPEALNSLKLPIKVKAGFLGSVKLKVVIVHRLFTIVHSATVVNICSIAS